MDIQAWRIGAVLLAGALLIAIPSTASAHIGHRNAVDLFDGISGPYDLRIVTVPLTSSFETTVVVRSNASTLTALTPHVAVQATSLGGEVLGPERALPRTPNAPEQYSVLWDTPTKGDWLLEISVESSLGFVEHQFPVTIRNAGGFSWSLAFIGAVLLTPAFISLALARRRSRRRSEK